MEISDLKLSDTLPTFDIPVDLVVPCPWNANEMKDVMFNRLVEELEENACISAIQVVPLSDGTYRVIGGEYRWRGAVTLGWKTIPAHVLNDPKYQDENIQRFLSVRLNVIKGEINAEKMILLFNHFSDNYSKKKLQGLFGFTDADGFNKLIGDIGNTLDNSSFGKDISKDFKKKASKVKTVDGLSSILKNLFNEYGNDLVHNFMVFVYGGKKHLYIAMSDNSQNAMDELLKICRDSNIDINDVLAGFLSESLKKVGIK